LREDPIKQVQPLGGEVDVPEGITKAVSSARFMTLRRRLAVGVHQWLLLVFREKSPQEAS
jgi:hypothetical protein